MTIDGVKLSGAIEIFSSFLFWGDDVIHEEGLAVRVVDPAWDVKGRHKFEVLGPSPLFSHPIGHKSVDNTLQDVKIHKV